MEPTKNTWDHPPGNLPSFQPSAGEPSFAITKRSSSIVSSHRYPSQGPAAVETDRGSSMDFSRAARLTENPSPTQAIILSLHAWRSCRSLVPSHVNPYGRGRAEGLTDYIAVSPHGEFRVGPISRPHFHRQPCREKIDPESSPVSWASSSVFAPC